ncbi:Membrane protein involved in the export of O-antigen and teichoic acid [Prevotella sp. ne3005]|uniref:hypothetical protein n=1 Tax=Prevotella sp. ne3005 TaxID=1761887 RepID=UPI0008ACAD52|nr:hypothetical protein [Prevotella sp. ne3005]SEM53480.1 Membrane protein involved in the export of O-antigen and teichoic acid [Prevotella sp. ne3005]
MAENKQLIAKNTLYLYARMLLVMCVTLYTSRVILHTLGATDYGVYSVVGGIVVMFSFLSGSLSGATSRYLAFDLGKGDKEQLNRTFSSSLNIYLSIALVIVLLGEMVGLWLVSNKLTIPIERLNAAYWVLHFSVITAFFSFSQYPYTASLLAHEDMSVYAYVGIYEAVSKLSIAFAITISPIDSLVFYAFLIMLNQICIQSFYRIYASRKYTECRFRLIGDSALYKRLLSYSGYDMLPSMCIMFQNQGADILLNVFFGPIANAARAIANQVNGALNQMVINLIQAARPQVIKDYAQCDPIGMYNLTFLVSKYAYLLMLAMTVPLFFEMDIIIQLWLGSEAPSHTVIYCRIVLLTGLISTFSYALSMPMHAIGKLRSFSIVNSLLYLLPIPICYLMFKLGAPDYTIFVAIFASNVIIIASTLFLLHRLEGFLWRDFFTSVFVSCFVITLISIIVPILLIHLLPSCFWKLVIDIILSEVVIGLLVWFVAMDAELRFKFKMIIHIKLHKNNASE